MDDTNITPRIYTFTEEQMDRMKTLAVAYDTTYAAYKSGIEAKIRSFVNKVLAGDAAILSQKALNALSDSEYYKSKA